MLQLAGTLKGHKGAGAGDSNSQNFTPANKGHVYWDSVVLERVIGRKLIPILWLLQGLCAHQIILSDEIMSLAGKGKSTDTGEHFGFAGI